MAWIIYVMAFKLLDNILILWKNFQFVKIKLLMENKLINF